MIVVYILTSFVGSRSPPMREQAPQLVVFNCAR
jgi:hypothetical protein